MIASSFQALPCGGVPWEGLNWSEVFSVRILPYRILLSFSFLENSL